MVDIRIDSEKCIQCMTCRELCPTSVFDKIAPENDFLKFEFSSDDCWACMTCLGKCKQDAISIRQNSNSNRYIDGGNEKAFVQLTKEEQNSYSEMSGLLENILKLRWKPVAVSLIRKGEPLPHVAVPEVRLRYCQSLIMARRGKTLLMPKNSHSCPDGTSILGISKVPEKLASGDIYLKLGKLASAEAAAELVRGRQTLPEESVSATLVSPLEEAIIHPDVVVIIAPPETMMWLSMSSTYFTGKRVKFEMGSYNAQCLETTVIPYVKQEINISLGCYGCRAVSDIGEELMFMGIPLSKMDTILSGLKYLGTKAIPDSRAKIYLPPFV